MLDVAEDKKQLAFDILPPCRYGNTAAGIEHMYSTISLKSLDKCVEHKWSCRVRCSLQVILRSRYVGFMMPQRTRMIQTA